MWMFYFVMLHIMLHSSTLEAAITELQPEGVQCACAGDRLIYNCSVVGGTATRWRGTAFDCPLGITLRHSQFAANQESGICNNGDIVGRSIGVVNDCYTSQLNMTVRESFNNKTVQCAFTSSEGTRAIAESLLRVASVTNHYPPPDNVYVADARTGTLVFNWTPVISNCSTAFLQYSITSDCGACPTVTNLTTATCSDLQLSTNAVMCQFSVSSHACGLVGNSSSPTAVTLKATMSDVPDVPQVEIIQSYSSDSQALQRLFIVTTVNQTEDHFYISGNISGSPRHYITHGSNLIGGTSFDSTVCLASCEEAGGCPIEVPSSSCSQLTIINVTISAANKLGEGPRSNPFMIECSNMFVEVLYRENSMGSSISCVFLNQSDASEKTCCVTYGPCDQPHRRSGQACSKDTSYNIQLEVADQSRYCYTVTASNKSHTVKVEGTFTLDDNRRRNSNTAAIIAGVIVPLIFLLLLGTGILLSLVWFAKKVKKRQTYQTEGIETTPLPNIMVYSQNPLKSYLKPYSVPATSILHKVDGDCDLRDFVTNSTGGSESFRRGHTYYEFTNEVENILEGKEVLLQDKKNTEKWFQLAPPEEVAGGRLKLYGEGIACNSFIRDQYRVFIQSFGSGARHLPKGSSILYNHSEDQVQPDALPLVPVCSENFAHKVIDSEEGLSVQQFCSQNKLNTTAFNIFLTVEHLPEGMRDQPPRDAILMDRVSGELFTGPFARQMFHPKMGGESKHDNEKWKLFVLLERNKQGLVLRKGSEVLYQDSNNQIGRFAVLDIDVDCVRLSKFIETKLNCQYEDGKAFYEVIKNEQETEEDEDEAEREEDLLYYKKILRPEKNELSCEELKLQSLIEYFYAIPGVPSMAVKPEHLRLQHHRIFIQSTSQGSRCLKKGEKILYLKEYFQQTGGSCKDSLNPSTITVEPST